MGNPLKDIFNTEAPQYISTLHFDDLESKKHFIDIMNQASENGEFVEVSGVSKIDNYIKSGNYTQKLNDSGEMIKFFIGPSKEKRPFTINTDYGEYTFEFESYKTKDSIIAETNKNTDTLYTKMVLHNDGKININFKLEISRAQNVESLICLLNAAYCLIQKMMPDGSYESNTQFKMLRGSEEYWKIVRKVEQSLGITFNPQKFSEDSTQMEKDEKSIFEVYYLFVEKCMIKQNNIKNLTIRLNKDNDITIPEIGQKIGLSYIDTNQKEFYGEKFDFYLENFIPKAIVSKIEEEDKNTIKIDITGTDTEPLILFYRAYKTKEEIDTLPDLNQINFDDVKSLPELIHELNT